MIRLALPVLIVVGTVVGLLGFGAWNRSGEPTIVIALTERELGRPWNWSSDRPEERGVPRLRLQWQDRGEPLESRNWVGEASLRAMGFLFPVTAGDPRAERTVDRTLPRVAWVVFEFDGPAWGEITRRRNLAAAAQRAPASRPDTPDAAPVNESRLVPVAAGPDFDVLARRYGDGRHLIMPAVFALHWVGPTAGGPMIYGVLREVVPPAITIPSAHRGAIDGERYEVHLAVGRAGLPWIRSVTPR